MAGPWPEHAGLDDPLRPSGADPPGGDDARHAFPARPMAPIPRFWLGLQSSLEREIERGGGFAWLAIAFAAGVLGYFVLPAEPWAPALAGATATLALVAWRLRHGRAGLFRVLLLAALVAGGAMAAKLRTDRVAAPRLDRQVTGQLAGFVEAREARRGGFRLTIRVVSLDVRGAGAPPYRVTVTVRGAAPAVGEGVTMLARLRPPSGPALPGGYDFGRPAFYAGIGGTGFAYGRVKPADLGPAPFAIRLKVPLERLREDIRGRIAAVLPGDTGRVATALVIGDSGGISEAGEDALRNSGLAHVLSVSGLHMVLVAGAVFWSVRALLALVPRLALRRPIKKWAALAALAVTAFYLLISGLDVAAQRSFIMTAVVFAAILLDRKAISIRNVAIAGLIVLVLAPESLLAAGFPMSFAATIALVAGFEIVTRRRRALVPVMRSAVGSVLRWLLALVAGLALTSLLGGLGTTPFALYHFQRMAPLSILANVAAMPLVDFLVMPMALLAVLAMPFGLDAPLLTLMGIGIDAMMAVAHTVSEWSAGAGDAAMPSAASLLIFVAGFLWLTLMRERWRMAGLVPMVLGGILAFLPHHPDLIIAPDGRQVAIRQNDGRYRILARKPDNFITEIWLRADGDGRDPRDAGLLDGTRCDLSGCTAPLPDGRVVALALGRDAFADDCRAAALIVTPLPDVVCAAQVAAIDRAVLDASGAIALDLRSSNQSLRSPSPALQPPSPGLQSARDAYAARAMAAPDRAPPDSLPLSHPGPAEPLDAEAIARTRNDEDIPPGLPDADLQPRINPLAEAFLVTPSFPPVRRPFMPPRLVPDDPEGAGQ